MKSRASLGPMKYKRNTKNRDHSRYILTYLEIQTIVDTLVPSFHMVVRLGGPCQHHLPDKNDREKGR